MSDRERTSASLFHSVLARYLAYARGESARSPFVIFRPLGFVARKMAGMRNFFFDHGLLPVYEPSLPVISVGNVTLGGTNKTPFVEMLARTLSSSGLHVGIVSRGYGGRTDRPVVIRGDQGSREVVGDEPLLLASRLPDVPVAVSKNRLRDVELLHDMGVEIVVADDAFQHRRLGRDVDIVLIDACCPFGNDCVAPAGILREPVESVSRAHAVVITKVDQVRTEHIAAIRERVTRYVPEERLFTSRIVVSEWRTWDGEWGPSSIPDRGTRGVSFCAIGNPSSFHRLLSDSGIVCCDNLVFKDHHRYCADDMRRVERVFKAANADVILCTEKDVYNLPVEYVPKVPFLVPLISARVDDEPRFMSLLASRLRPRIVVCSNGYGEDSMGALLAEKLRARFPEADIGAFPIVGKGELYAQRGIRIDSVPADSPTGGVVKYSLLDLWKDIRAGLFRNIGSQMEAWRPLRGAIRTPLCVGDVYLLMHTLWGQGQIPLFVATAKTVYLSGHWRVERFLLKHRSRMTWTRDRETAGQLSRSGVAAVFEGNPIMDLTCDNSNEIGSWALRPEDASGPDIRPGRGTWWNVLLLPGSRGRAYEDMRLLLETASILHVRQRCLFCVVVAPTLDLAKLVPDGWDIDRRDGDGRIRSRSDGGLCVRLYFGSLAPMARGADILIGFGGTANQVCAGLGVPVVSTIEKGKLVQKKLLGGSEVLVERNARAIADAALGILTSPALWVKMSREGIERLGAPGALDHVVEHTATALGWDTRLRVFGRLRSLGWEEER